VQATQHVIICILLPRQTHSQTAITYVYNFNNNALFFLAKMDVIWTSIWTNNSEFNIISLAVFKRLSNMAKFMEVPRCTDASSSSSLRPHTALQYVLPGWRSPWAAVEGFHLATVTATDQRRGRLTDIITHSRYHSTKTAIERNSKYWPNMSPLWGQEHLKTAPE